MDVVTAFLVGELEEEIYIEQPEGFKVGNEGEDFVCQIWKNLYGLKQTPYIWNRWIQQFLRSIGFKPTYSDLWVYVHSRKGVIIAMWVDNLMSFGKNITDIEDIKVQLKEEYEIKGLGELKYFLGVQVHRDREWKLIHIN